MRQLAECYPVQVICRVWETPRSSYYYQSQVSDEYELRTALQRLAGEWPRYGSRRLTAQLRREVLLVEQQRALETRDAMLRALQEERVREVALRDAEISALNGRIGELQRALDAKLSERARRLWRRTTGDAT